MSDLSDDLGIVYREGFETRLAQYLAETPRSGEHLLDIKRILIRFLKAIFGEEPFGKDAPASPAWRTNQDQVSQLRISDEGPLNTQEVERTPHIVLQRGTFAWANTSLDQHLHTFSRTGQTVSTDLFVGSFVLHVVAQEPLFAERIAVSVFRLLTYYRPILQRRGLFKVGPQGLSIGRGGPVADLVPDAPRDKFWDVPVVMPVYFQDTWTVTPVHPTFRALRYTMVARGKLLDGSEVYQETFDLGETVAED